MVSGLRKLSKQEAAEVWSSHILHKFSDIEPDQSELGHFFDEDTENNIELPNVDFYEMSVNAHSLKSVCLELEKISKENL
jgi:hypothetical protein